jgi:cytoskeletal protein CcmA (bactofilin family)
MKSSWIRRLSFVLLAVPTLVFAGHGLASAAGEQGPVLIEDMNEPVVVLTGWLEVPGDVTVDDAVIFNGNATIAGHVTGTVLAFNGDVTVTGTVDGDVASISGRVIVEDGAVVNGSITSQQPAEIAPGAQVGGSVTENQFNVDVVFIGRVAFWLAASVASLLFGLLLILFAPRAAEATATAARRRVGPSVGFGFLLFLGIPVLGVIALVTVLAALFGAAVLTGMVLLYLVAYAAGALSLGRLLLKPPRAPALAFLLGWIILRVMALVPVLGGFLFVAAAIWGFGALAVAAFKAGRGQREDASEPPVDHAAPGAATPAPPIPPAP